MQTMNVSRLRLMLLVIFVLSGAAGLIYQSIWTQYLGLFLGHAAYAQSLVLILFMGGMGLGAWLVSRWSESVARPLMAYAAIEFLLGLFGLTFDSIYRFSTEFAYAHLFSADSPGMVGVTRWGLAALLIFPQCVLLGATFPLMSAGCLRYMPDSGGRILSGLYFSNSIGAAGGALLATFTLLPLVGLPGTLMTAALLNIIVALCAWPIGKTALPSRVADAGANASMAPLVVLITAAITGLTSFVYEVVWVRMLALVVGSTVHAFELMLAAFISGLAFGGLYLKSRADQYADPLRAVAWIQIFMGLAALSSLWLYASAFEWVGTLMSLLGRNDASYAAFNFATAVICLLIMFPAAFFAGMTLPLLTLTLLRRGGERVIGQVYAANTLGCIVGVLVSVHVLLPLAGVKYALWLAAAADLLLGIVLFIRAGGATPRRRDAALAFAVSACALVLTATLVNFSPLALASSVYRRGKSSLAEGTNMMYYRDGKTATVAMFQMPKNHMRSVATNGKVDASANLDKTGPRSTDEYTMTLAGVLPLAYAENAKLAGVIGFGSGITTHTLLASKQLTRVDTIEIEPSMVEASRNFEWLSERAYKDPRSHIVIDDAKAYFSATNEKYDIIVSEPSNPWVSGVATLFTEEFYRFIPKHLSEDGIFVQWVQLYEITPDLVSTVVRALLPHFEDVEAYMTNTGDMLIVAKPKGKLPPLSETGMKIVGDASELIGASSVNDLQFFRLFGRDGLAAFASMYRTNPNSDFFPILQLNAPKARFVQARATDLALLQLAPLPVLEVAGEYQPTPISQTPFRTGVEIARYHAVVEGNELRREMLGQTVSFPIVSQAVRMSAVAVVRDFGRRCEDPGASMLWFASAVAVAQSTIPVFTPEDLQGVWIDPQWAKNCAKPSPMASEGLAMFSAMARREWPAVERHVGSLLALPETDKVPGAARYLLSVRLVAEFTAGKYVQMEETIARIGEKEADGLPAFYESWLTSLARLRAAK